MSVSVINPHNGQQLARNGDYLIDPAGNKFRIIDGVPRIAAVDNYANSFGFQWNKFSRTQLDREADGLDMSRRRLFAETHWDKENLLGKDILEVGSGAGRFSKVILEHTKGSLYSVDYSNAVTANIRSNGDIDPKRFQLFQASIYELPFPDNSFDKVFCLGVLQHTPDFDASIKCLIDKAKPGGEIVVDFYPIKGWWTRINAKYILRPLTKKLSQESLYSIIVANIDWLIKAHSLLNRWGLGAMTRFLPVCNIGGTFPKTLTPEELREWAILDTFDMFSPEHDHPQRISTVVKIFKRHGAAVTFAGFEQYGEGMMVAVVRGVKRG